MDDLWRVAAWGLAAAAALTIAAFAITAAVGIDRLMQAAGQQQGVVKSTGDKPSPPLDAREGQRLAESVRLLADDRDRLLARINAVERSIDTITGSVVRMSKVVEAATERRVSASVPDRGRTAAAPSPEAPSSEAATAEESTASVDADAGLHPPLPVPLPQARPASDQTAKTEFGLDIGGGGTLAGLRTLWATARQRYPTVLNGLRPVVHLRDSRRAGGIELRLVAGPLPNAAAAARLCATLNAAGAACQPAVFDGQQLAAR
jgi:hypothetical protein